jgi:holo-[acyl-carrier protein] synthase
MVAMTLAPDTFPPPSAAAPGGLRMGLDMVRVADVQASLDAFGGRFVDRFFSAAEQADALAVPALNARRLAARFAAKEAAIKAFGLSEAGVSWREMEVCRDGNGACRLRLHGKAAALAGVQEAAVSISDQRGYAIAIVLA